MDFIKENAIIPYSNIRQAMGGIKVKIFQYLQINYLLQIKQALVELGHSLNIFKVFETNMTNRKIVVLKFGIKVITPYYITILYYIILTAYIMIYFRYF